MDKIELALQIIGLCPNPVSNDGMTLINEARKILLDELQKEEIDD